MTRKSDDSKVAPPAIGSVEELMAHAYAIEAEAEERYRDLAEQMEAHNNTDVAALFRRLADYEGEHAREIEARAAELSLPALAPWEFKWSDAEAPELVDTLSMHYLMSPHMALALALDAERRAFTFFRGLADAAVDPEIRQMAVGFAAEEEEHVRMIEDMLSTLPPPEPGWDDDPDPPGQG